MRAVERLFDAGACARPAPRAERVGERARLGALAIDDADGAGAGPGQRDADRLADAAGADERDDSSRNVSDRPPDGLGEAAAIGVEADEPSFATPGPC